MDFSDVRVWDLVIQLGIVSAAILFSNLLRRKIPFFRNSLMPTAVLAGFLLFIIRNALRYAGIDGVMVEDTSVLETLTYHGLALGFIAMSLRVPKLTGTKAAKLTSAKSGALIVSTYLVQAFLGMGATLLLYTFLIPGKAEIFKAAGVLLPMGFGQGTGQANNVGGTYEALGLTGGKSYGLAIAAAGYLVACIVGVIYINIMNKKGLVKRKEHSEVSGSVSVDTFQDSNEIPISESIDRLSMQAALVLLVYFLSYLIIFGITKLVAAVAPGLSATVDPLLWGFNFIFASLVALLIRVLFKNLRRIKAMTRQYQNNYLLSRISGLAFDVMIVAGIASINISELNELIIPFLILSALGGVSTFFYLKWICKKIYPDYSEEAFVSMFGMLTGTISSGVLLLREIDTEFDTPAANNLVTGSSFAILFGIPMLLVISFAPGSATMTTTTAILISLAAIVVYFVFLYLFATKLKPKKKINQSENEPIDSEEIKPQ